MSKYVLFDTETTGNKEEDRIIQIGSMIVDSDSGKVEVFEDLCYNNTPIKFEAMGVHNITPEMIEDKLLFNQTNTYQTLSNLNIDENYLIAHNLPFDLGMIEKEGFANNYNLIDTLRVVRHLLPDLESHKLQVLRYSLGLYKTEEQVAEDLNVEIKAHDAIGDVLVMKMLFDYLYNLCVEKFPDSNPIEKMVELTDTPVMVKIFKFGKHKGKVIEEVIKYDRGYLEWMLNKMTDLDEDLKYTLEELLT